MKKITIGTVAMIALLISGCSKNEEYMPIRGAGTEPRQVSPEPATGMYYDQDVDKENNRFVYYIFSKHDITAVSDLSVIIMSEDSSIRKELTLKDFTQGNSVYATRYHDIMKYEGYFLTLTSKEPIANYLSQFDHKNPTFYSYKTTIKTTKETYAFQRETSWYNQGTKNIWRY